MSKELIEVKQEGTKSKLKELVLWIFICLLGSAVVFVSFFISYKKINSGSLLNNGVSHIEVIPETENEEVIIDDKKEENAEEEENEDIDEEITVEEANKLLYEQVKKLLLGKVKKEKLFSVGDSAKNRIF